MPIDRKNSFPFGENRNLSIKKFQKKRNIGDLKVLGSVKYYSLLLWKDA